MSTGPAPGETAHATPSAPTGRLVLVYLCPLCLGVYDAPEPCEDCGVATVESVLRLSEGAPEREEHG